MSAGKCKRGLEVLLGTTSSSSDDDSPRSADTSATATTEPLSPSSSSTTCHDCDVSSPGSSSTLSGGGGPSSELRLPGFGQQQRVTPRRPRVKKKKASDLSRAAADDVQNVSYSLQGATPRIAEETVQHHQQLNTSSRLAKHQLNPRTKPAREPVPMRMRALPQSMWQEPNIPHNVSPATVYPVLPPLVTREGDDITGLRPVTPPQEQEEGAEKCPQRDNKSVLVKPAAANVALAPAAATAAVAVSGYSDTRRLQRPLPERSITVANPDLLMRLFDVVDHAGRKINPSALTGHIRRSRSKKVLIAAGGGHKSSLLSGQDPHMVDNIAETLFPQLSLERSARTTTTTTFNSTAIVNLQPLTIGDKTILLPSLTTDQNYPQMLSEVVANI